MPGFGRLDAIVVHLNRPEHWQAFEALCRDLLGRLFNDIHSDLHGRTGQAQGGVDLWAVDRGSGVRVRAQCKMLEGRGSLDEATIRALVQEVKAGEVRPDRYMILTTAPNHAPNKTLAGELSEPDFEVQIHGWDWISGKLEDHDDLIDRYKLARFIDRSARAGGSPVAREIGMNSGHNAFGPGNRVSASGPAASVAVTSRISSGRAMPGTARSIASKGLSPGSPTAGTVMLTATSPLPAV